MPFQMPCMNKKCNKTVTPYLDKDTNKVYCSECGDEITNVTHFAKIQMQTLKQYKTKKLKSFSVKCEHCKDSDRPIVKDSKIFCKSCNKEHSQLTSVFKKMLIDQLKKVED